ncbi:discoidin domain-containing protein [Actinokineospora soli]|uniref:Discoidin domain-containing protein n=1 Tax=Actinokineospora soli TaxID=1048753 RepID=A0ABW2TT03_9PSEU
MPIRLAACLLSAALAAPTPPAVGVSAELAGFWRAYRAGAPDLAMRAARLDHVVRTGLGHDAEPVREAVRLLAGDPARAWTARLALLGARGPAAQRSFVDAAVREYDTAYAARPAAVTTTLGAHGGHGPDRMTDGDPATYYWSAGPAVAGAAVTVDLGGPRRVRGVRLLLGKPDRPLDHLRRGVLEFSPDGRTWTPVARVERPEHAVDVTADTRFVRLRSEADQPHWLVVRELSVVACPTGRATDGDPTTVFTVTGEAVELPLSADRPASALVVRAAPGTAPGGEVQVRAGAAGWATVGRLAGPYTEVPLPEGGATRVRIVRGGEMTPWRCTRSPPGRHAERHRPHGAVTGE